MSIQTYRDTIRHSKRDSIIRAAWKIFSAVGFARAGMTEIAKAADVSTATLYKHFISKEELFSQIAVDHIAPFHARAEELLPKLRLSEDPVDALMGLSASFADLLADDQTLALFRLTITEGDRFPELKEIIYRYGRDPFKARLTQVLQAFHQRGIVHIAEAPSAAEFYIGMLSYWLLFAPIFNSEMKFSPEQIQHIIRENTLMFLSRFDSQAGSILGRSDMGPSLRNGNVPKLTPSMDIPRNPVSA